MSTLLLGLHYGVSAKRYHADPVNPISLSSGIARKLLSESPAHAYLAHPKLGGAGTEETASMGLGSLVHSLMDDNPEKDWVLGPFDSYKGGEARLWRDGIIAAGKTPALERDLVEARPVVDALRAKVIVPPDAKSEVTAIWKEGDVVCRARYDRLHVAAGRANVWDWKSSSNDMSDRGLIKTIVKYGYHIQVGFYLRGLAACTGLDPSALTFTLVFVQTKAPYTVRQVRLTEMFLHEGDRKAEEAIEKWSTCLRTNDWSDPRESEVFEADMPLWMDEVDIEISPAS